MAHWFSRIMQQGHARPEIAAESSARQDKDRRYEGIVRMLRERESEDREAREKRQLGYRQFLENETAAESGASAPAAPVRLYRFRTRVPCRVTPEARALLDRLKRQYPGSSLTFQQPGGRRRAVMLGGGAGAEPRQIGWLEQCVQSDPSLCNVRHQGLTVETDSSGMLLLRFRYPSTGVRMTSRHHGEVGTLPAGEVPSGMEVQTRIEGLVPPQRGGDGLEQLDASTDEVASVDFTEIRPALDLRPSDKGASPRLVWVSRPEVKTMNALGSRDYEAFYVRFKLEVQAGLWSTLSGLLSNSPGSHWHQGAYYTVVREPDATNGRIYQKTIDDALRPVDIGLDRTYDASAATDILLLYLGGDILADLADIYFALHSLSSADAYFLKEELFALVRRFWASSQSLTSRYGSEVAAVARMAQRAVPTPAQAPLLKEDWTNLRQALVDRYGEGGRNASDLVGRDLYRARGGLPAWPFAAFPAGEVNVGLRVVYRQEWRQLGAQRGEVVRTVPPAARQLSPRLALGGPGADELHTVETIIERGETTRTLPHIVEDASRATVKAMKWPLEMEGSINTGVRPLAARTDMGLEAECRESSRDTSTRLGDIMRRMVSKPRDDASVVLSADRSQALEPAASPEPDAGGEPDTATYVYSRLRQRYEVLTRPAEIQNVVLVAEKLPAPGEIDLSWVKRHDWILARVLLDESFRDALESVSQEARSTDAPVGAAGFQGAREQTVERIDTFSGTATVRPDGVEMEGEWKRGYRERSATLLARPAGEDERAPAPREADLAAGRERLCEHLRSNILHYQRAIWQQEDPQQRSMRYRKSGKKVPLEWRFELESGGALTIDELRDRLGGKSVDGQFAAYAAGREADLDQVIDPAGPIGYYGNYAIYPMRPEFGSDDLFSMLHFFKSPYLRPNPDTGQPEVDDPAQIRISYDPAVAGASDQLLEQHREEMFRNVPELRLERARARKKVSEGSDPGALLRLERQPDVLRRHLPTYLFRRERARGIALDTDSLVIDIIRELEPAPEPPPRADGAIEAGAAPDGSGLTLERGPGIQLLGANDSDEAEAEWALVLEDGEGVAGLLAGAGGGAPPLLDPLAEPLIPLAGDGEPGPLLLVGSGAPPEAASEGVILPGEQGGWDVAERAQAEAEPVILVQLAGEHELGLLVGGGAEQGRDPAPELLIITRAEPGLLVAGGAEGAVASRPAILAGAPGLLAGEPRGGEAGPTIVPAGAGQQGTGLRGGTETASPGGPASEQPIRPTGAESVRPSLVAG